MVAFLVTRYILTTEIRTELLVQQDPSIKM